MSEAYEITPLMQIVEPPSGQIYKEYFFRYGPPWKRPFDDRERYLYKERFRVYFDNARRAWRVERYNWGAADMWYNYDVHVNLADNEEERSKGESNGDASSFRKP